ncbi:hypothetical protein C0992_007480 [Termitomyces sp. T32_za158]|nr:hypothetical protein C0992_007480 [Termitomyces sp. T32_za158]
MALNTAANLATIGSFAVDVLSLGFLTINRYKNIRDPLVEADGSLDGAMDAIAKYSKYLDDQEFEKAMEKYDKARALVDQAYQDRSSFENFIVRAKRCSKNKTQVHIAKLESQGVANWKTSVNAKRREDVGKRKINHHKMEERLRRLTKAGFQPSNSNDNRTAMGEKLDHSEPDVARPLSPIPTPFPGTDNKLKNPFQGLDTKENENSWKTETSGSISLQSFASK